MTLNEAASERLVLADQGAPVLSVRGVSKTYETRGGERTLALESMSFDAHEGEFIALVGPSGCGKTTLLKMCAGLLQATTGEIDYKGTREPVPAGGFGMVFQSATLLPWRSILSNTMLPAQILRLDKSKARQRAADLLDLVGLGEAKSKIPGELSGGMQQRASIARALLHDPPILFMDEPFGALDAITRQEMGAELQRIHLAQKKTVLFVTHSIQEAVLLSDRILVFSNRPGRLVADVAVDYPRPRTFESTLDADFRQLEARIHAYL